IQLMSKSSIVTITTAIAVAVRKFGIKYGNVWPIPPAVVINPQTTPRSRGLPRPVRLPSSEAASANPIEIPAPTLAARPTRNAAWLLWVANAAAKTGARVETEPSINPAQPGLHDLQNEQSAMGFVFLCFNFRSQVFLLEI